MKIVVGNGQWYVARREKNMRGKREIVNNKECRDVRVGVGIYYKNITKER